MRRANAEGVSELCDGATVLERSIRHLFGGKSVGCEQDRALDAGERVHLDEAHCRDVLTRRWR
jgi:hypothetical protein